MKYSRLYTVFVGWLGAGLLSCGVGVGALAEKLGSRPNVVFLLTDDQQNDELGYLEGKALTPHFDRMAAEGVRFNRHYVASSVCSPSRYTCLAGQFASRCTIPFFTDQSTPEGVRRVLWNLGFADDQPILPKVLQHNGYRTGFVGKWHINGVGITPQVPKGSNAADPEIAAKLKANYAAICEDIKAFGFDYVKGAYRGNLHDDPLLVNTGMDEHNMEWLTKSALDFIDESARGDEPFYLYFATTLTHVPDVNTSLAADPRISGEGLLDEPITGVLPPRASVYERLDAAGVDRDLAKATWLDDGVGALMKKLEDLGIADNTVIIYMNDHGMASRSKGTAYEGGLITPALAWGPGLLKPQVVDTLTQNTDFVPTIFDLAGVTPPAEMVIDGKSWLPLVAGDVERTHTSVYSEIGLTRSVTTDDGWKYIAFRVPPSFQRTLDERLADQAAYWQEELQRRPNMRGAFSAPDPRARYHQMGMAPGGHRFERGQLNPNAAWIGNYFDADQLYNLNVDPVESTNLAADPAHAVKLAEMKALLRGYLETMPDTFEDLLDVDAGPMTVLE